MRIRSSGRLLILLGIMVLTLGLVACSSDSSDDATDEETPAATADETEEAEETEEASSDDGEVAENIQGKEPAEFFQLNCSSCHGANREGLVGPALTPDALTEDDQFYVDTIADGRPGTVMPSWTENGLTMPEIRLMVQYLKTDDPAD